MIHNQVGAEYLYDDDTLENTPLHSTSTKTVNIDLNRLAKLAPNLLSNLEAATHRIEWNHLLDIIEEVQPFDADLATMLLNAVQNFQYQQILTAIQAVKEDA